MPMRDAERARKDALGERFAGQAADQQEPSSGEQQIIAGRELQGELGDRRRAHGERQDADEAADHVTTVPRRCQPGFAALRQRIAVERRRDRGGRARDVEQDAVRDPP